MVLTNKQLNQFDEKRRMSDTALATLEQTLELYEPKSILELGSGASTLVLNDYVKSMQERDVDIICWSIEQRKAMVKPETRHMVRVIPTNKQFYDLTQLARFGYPEHVDLLIIDGPAPPKLRATDAAVEFYKGCVGKRTIVVVDDTKTKFINDVVDQLNDYGDFELTRIPGNVRGETTLMVPRELLMG